RCAAPAGIFSTWATACRRMRNWKPSARWSKRSKILNDQSIAALDVIGSGRAITFAAARENERIERQPGSGGKIQRARPAVHELSARDEIHRRLRPARTREKSRGEQPDRSRPVALLSHP